MEPFLGQIDILAFGFPPKGWALCNGQLLSIQQNQALFSLLGTTYGGDGRTTFALPDFRGRVPLHVGNGYIPGDRAGEEQHTLTSGELPAHTHQVQALTAAGTVPVPAGNLLASAALYDSSSAALNQMAPASLSVVGGSQPHSNMPPVQTLNFVIALVGTFPSRN
ncbi:phage tail protein [Deinococcus aquatilis]|uniref:phage tail protein n=1 Tax=Deinococcus aquatilis TaxID=519440 RepID=UPI0003676B87|nr:tail fiber protein [Deinococcus aquatilis]